MERKIAGLLGTLAGLATVGSAVGSTDAHAAGNAAATSQEPLAVNSYSDLLQPIPNAVEALKAHNAVLDEQARNALPEMEEVQWNRGREHHHHHHHHHHGYYAPRGEYYYQPPPPPVYYEPRPPAYYYHHHHHHHHHHYNGAVVVPGIGIQFGND
ncbi:hypothetical protein [Paraburkholderia phosphatilytica]|uniref:hypothetical protein n=1 Tax=Paraburkholderia phosphatilytica TaxID=2282883 RepID=UPI000E495CD8|nr:hypothetical protein [Paraburkholderia phosphatilytica]